MDRAELYTQVKDALDALYDPMYLRNHPLGDALCLSSMSSESRAEALRQLLWETIESLRPPDRLPLGRSEWVMYNVLKLRYLHAKQPTQVQDEIGLSRATYYRRQREGLDTVVGLIAEQMRSVPWGESSAPMSVPPLCRQAREEAIEVARKAKRQAVSISEIIGEIGQTIDRLLEPRGASIQIRAATPLPRVSVNRTMLRLVILNIIAEALELTNTPSLILAITADSERTLWCLSELQEQVDGQIIESSGGLHVSEGLLRYYGGRLWIGKDGRGRPAILWSLPVDRPRNILVIEDNNQTIELYRRYLSDQGYTVYKASNPLEMTAQLESTELDAVLLDVIMPGIDGWTILESLRVRKETADVPIIVCSVLSQPHVAYALGASEVLAKPFSQQDLLQALDRLLKGS